MLQFITRRLLYLIPSLLGIVLITFILSRVLPGDPALMIAGEQAPQHVVENIRAQLGLNEPLYVQFGAYIKQLAQGDLGIAWHTGHTVVEDFAVRLPATIELGFASLLIAL